MGVDVPLEKIESLLRHRMWGDVYAFLVDRSDLAAIVHPYAKPTAQASTTCVRVISELDNSSQLIGLYSLLLYVKISFRLSTLISP